MSTTKLQLKDNQEALLICGKQDENLRSLEKRFNVQIFLKYSSNTNGPILVIRGAPKKVNRVAEILKEIRKSAGIDIANQFTETLLNEKTTIDKEFTKEIILTTFTGRKITTQTPNQKKYVDAIDNYDVVIVIGPAGTGKTYLAVACALSYLKQGKVSKIVLSRPVVEAGEKLGYLPGDLYQKVHPYLKPVYDAFYNMLGPEEFVNLREEETIEIVPVAYMRGRTFDNSFLILDEAQNTTFGQLKMFLTRLGFNSKAVVTGDITQVDLDKAKSGLILSQNILNKISEVKFIHFDDTDIIRNPLVKKIIHAFDEWEKNKKIDL